MMETGLLGVGSSGFTDICLAWPQGSVREMVMRTKDWIRQAAKDLEHSKRSVDLGDYEWACFSAQQATEKAVKALYQSIHIEAWGHAVSKLLNDIQGKTKVPPALIEKAKELDKHYIPPRYPTFHSEGAPMDYYTKAEAQRAVEYADEIIKFCKSKIPESQL